MGNDVQDFVGLFHNQTASNTPRRNIPPRGFSKPKETQAIDEGQQYNFNGLMPSIPCGSLNQTMHTGSLASTIREPYNHVAAQTFRSTSSYLSTSEQATKMKRRINRMRKLNERRQISNYIENDEKTIEDTTHMNHNILRMKFQNNGEPAPTKSHPEQQASADGASLSARRQAEVPRTGRRVESADETEFKLQSSTVFKRNQPYTSINTGR